MLNKLLATYILVEGAMMKLFSLTALLLIATVSTAYAQSIQAGSTWVNAGGSELSIASIGSDGAISGTYVNKVNGFSCKNEPMNLIGWLDGDLISFTVRWKNKNVDCKSITSWTGYFASGKIYTEWDLVYTASNTGLPTHLKNSNVFEKK